MKNHSVLYLISFSLLVVGCASRHAEICPPLKLVQTIPLPGVEGKFDHLAIDLANQRLFVAAKINNTVEVVDLKTSRRVQSVAGFHEPQGILYRQDAKQVVVANGGNGEVQFLGHVTLNVIRRFGFGEDADNIRYDALKHRVYVACKDGALGVIDASANTKLGEVKLPAHPEAFTLEPRSERIFVNVPKVSTVFVLDRRKLKIIASWPLTAAKTNYTMALDGKHGRLFVGCREPASMVVLDTTTGQTITTLPIGGDTDCIFYDEAHLRIYVTGAKGTLDVVEQLDPNHYSLIDRLKTPPVARTCLYVPELDRLFVAVPRQRNHDAEIHVYQACH